MRTLVVNYATDNPDVRLAGGLPLRMLVEIPDINRPTCTYDEWLRKMALPNTWFDEFALAIAAIVLEVAVYRVHTSPLSNNLAIDDATIVHYVCGEGRPVFLVNFNESHFQTLVPIDGPLPSDAESVALRDGLSPAIRDVLETVALQFHRPDGTSACVCCRRRILTLSSSIDASSTSATITSCVVITAHLCVRTFASNSVSSTSTRASYPSTARTEPTTREAQPFRHAGRSGSGRSQGGW